MARVNDPQSTQRSRYVRSWKCQVSVGELYRWILAKLSDKDIKRALHKYRDLMPRQSDWNRKLTQATSMPELGFRYLYRCGQIDESNHRTMQKMLKYIDRQDVLPYFDTILYNTNSANSSLKELQKILLDKVCMFLELSSNLSEDEIHPDPPYEVHRCQPLDLSRMTRSGSKRKSDSSIPRCYTVVKRLRSTSSDSNAESPSDQPNSPQTGSTHCGRATSVIAANALMGPVMRTLLSTSLLTILATLKNSAIETVLRQNFRVTNPRNEYRNPRVDANLVEQFLATLRPIDPGFMPIPRIPYYIPQNVNWPPLRPRAQQVQDRPPNPAPVGNANRPVMIPELVGIDRANIPVVNELMRIARLHNPIPPADGNAGGVAGDPLLGPFPLPFPAPFRMKQVVCSAGGVGLTKSDHDTLLRFYCSLKLRVVLDFGPPTDALERVHSDRDDFFDQQLHCFTQASNLLSNRLNAAEFTCHLRFNRLSELEHFWRDYQSGTLKDVLKDMVKAPLSRSFVGQLIIDPGDVENMFIFMPELAQQWARPTNSARSGFSAGFPTQTPIELLATAIRNVRLRQGGIIPPTDETDIHLFVSRRDYENCRALLVRNMRTVPSLCRLLAAFNYIPKLGDSDLLPPTFPSGGVPPL